MEQNKIVTPEFEELYQHIDLKTSHLAFAILDQVSKNDERILKKINIRLENFINEIKDIK